MNNNTTEIRYAQKYNLGNQKSTFATGIRQSYASFKRQGGGEGTHHHLGKKEFCRLLKGAVLLAPLGINAG